MINANEFRLKDLDEVVNIDIARARDGSKMPELDVTKIKAAYFPIGKGAYMSYAPVAKSATGEVFLKLQNNVLLEGRAYDGETGLQLAQVDLNSLLENFIVFDYLTNAKAIMGRTNTDVMETYALINNMRTAMDCGTELVPVSGIVSPEVYEKAMARAKKAFGKQQEQTIDSQTPTYDL